ncbi:coniferyl alcohol acyltransferase-like [Salvia divinorum]|uniref:Coniferyl alcohol acyltransferase-like n=1 Tax=Salvia divinorum TaxID=28513 RepID=A0ABD1GV72_SALDI
MVSACIATASTAEHYLALIDWVEVWRPKAIVGKGYCKGESHEATVVVSSGQRFPMRMLDFGWGGPDFGSYHFPWGSGYVMPMLSVRMGMGIGLCMCISRKCNSIWWRPLSPHYLKF